MPKPTRNDSDDLKHTREAQEYLKEAARKDAERTPIDNREAPTRPLREARLPSAPNPNKGS